MILAILQARMGSTRLPGKVLKPILGKPMLALQIERILRAKKIDKLVLATSSDRADQPLVQLAKACGVECYQGDLENVLDRFYQAALPHRPDHVVRLTGDCPIIDPELLDQLIEFHLNGQFDYSANCLEPTFPDGLDAEIMRWQALKEAHQEARLPSELEHVTPFIHRKPARYHIGHFKNATDYSQLRWTVDEPKDFELIEKIYHGLYPFNPVFSWKEVMVFLDQHPELKTYNTEHQRNEGMKKSLLKDQVIKDENVKRSYEMTHRYQQSEAFLKRAEHVIPLGSQTFSKSKTQFPEGVSPYFMTHGEGAYVWDLDGNRYIDFVCSLLAISLGYKDKDVDSAVKKQLEEGVIFSLPHPLETELAEKIIQRVPCAEMVRFGKNGSDATAGAIRLARAFTKRDHVAVCGYHGWQDWYIGSTTRDLGVPEAVKALTHKFTYNNLESLQKIFETYPGQMAAVMMEPINFEEPKPGFLEGVQNLCKAHGAVFIFDETITGFRFANGGAQEMLGITPDLVTLGKGMSNGYPLSVVAGRRDIMMLMEDIFFSFTFGGETLSLAAGLAVLNKMEREPVLEHIHQLGRYLIVGVKKLIANLKLEAVLDIKGHPAWSLLVFKDIPQYSAMMLKTFWMQEIQKRGILSFGSHNLCYAHQQADVDTLLSVYQEVFALMANHIQAKTLEQALQGKVLAPLFKVR